MGFKPKSAQLESQLDNLTKTVEPSPEFRDKVPEPLPLPESKMAKARRSPEYKSEMAAKGVTVEIKAPTDLSVVITQLQNIWEKLLVIESRLGKPVSSTTVMVVDETHPASYPKTTNGHPITKSGKVAPFIEVPSVEQLIARASVYGDKHGKPALAALVKGFGVKKVSEMNDEQRASFMEQLEG